MLFKNEAQHERKQFSIVLDSVSDDNELIQEQLQLDLSEDIDGTIIIDKETISKVNHELIFKKLADVGSQLNDEILLGEIMFKHNIVRITSKHIILLNHAMEI